jgi:hypothetical protein
MFCIMRIILYTEYIPDKILLSITFLIFDDILKPCYRISKSWNNRLVKKPTIDKVDVSTMKRNLRQLWATYTTFVKDFNHCRHSIRACLIPTLSTSIPFTTMYKLFCMHIFVTLWYNWGLWYHILIKLQP